MWAMKIKFHDFEQAAVGLYDRLRRSDPSGAQVEKGVAGEQTDHGQLSAALAKLKVRSTRK